MDGQNVELEKVPNILLASEYNAECFNAQDNLETKSTENTSSINENNNLTQDRPKSNDGINSKRILNISKFHVNNQGSKEHLKTVEELVVVLQKDNERLTNQLAEERHRSFINQRKLRYIQEHHDVFQRLKDAYLNLKYNKVNNSPLAELKEIACQIYPEEETCVDDANTTDNLKYPDNASECITIYRKDLKAVKLTMKSLESHLTSGIELSSERENKYRKDIAALYKDNLNLKDQFKEKKNEIETLKKRLNAKKIQNSILRKIVAKFLRKLSQNRNIKDSVETLLNVNEAEKTVIDIITAKYVKKQLDKKNEEKLESPLRSIESVSMSIDDDSSTPFYTPRVLESP